MLQQADILASVKARWDRDGTLTAAVPGGLHHAENTGTAEPWARMWLEEGEVEWNSGKVYTQEWTLNLGIFSTKGPVDAGQIGRAADALFNRDRPQDFLLPGPNARVLATWPEPGTLELDEDSREARAVLVQGRRYRLLVQAER
jgi:hypothetical protein